MEEEEGAKMDGGRKGEINSSKRDRERWIEGRRNEWGGGQEREMDGEKEGVQRVGETD